MIKGGFLKKKAGNELYGRTKLKANYRQIE